MRRLFLLTLLTLTWAVSVFAASTVTDDDWYDFWYAYYESTAYKGEPPKDSPLRWAINRDRYEIAEQLILMKEMPSDWAGAAVAAIHKGQSWLFHLMLDMGADPLESRRVARKLLEGSLFCLDVDVVVRLLNNGVDECLPRNELSNAMCAVLWNKNNAGKAIDLFQLLVDRGARFNQGHLYNAFKRCAIVQEVTRFILENSDQMNFDPGEGHNLLTLICRKEYSSEQEEDDHFAVFELLLEHGALPNTVEPMPSNPFMGRVYAGDGITPLASAIRRHDPRFVQALLDHGADPELTMAGGAAPLLMAIWHQNPEAVEQLLQAGADPFRKTGKTSKKESPLELAHRLANESSRDEPCRDAILSYLASHPHNQ